MGKYRSFLLEVHGHSAVKKHSVEDLQKYIKEVVLFNSLLKNFHKMKNIEPISKLMDNLLDLLILKN